MTEVIFEETVKGFTGTDVVGESVPATLVTVRTRSGQQIVWEESRTTGVTVESVCGTIEQLLNMALDWAMKNLGYKPTNDDLDRAGWL